MLSSCRLCLALLDMWASRGGEWPSFFGTGIQLCASFFSLYLFALGVFFLFLFCFCSLFPCSLYLSCPKRGNRSGLVLVCAAANLHAKELSMSIGRFVQPSVPRAFRFALYYSFLCSSSSASSSLFP